MVRTRSSSRKTDNTEKAPAKLTGVKKRATAKSAKNTSSTAKSKQVVADKEDGPSYYLFKSEPESRIQKGQEMKYSIDDLAGEKDATSYWDGVRNYEARNVMKTMSVGELGFFYHSNTRKSRPGIVGIVKVVKEAYPDHTAFDENDVHFDAKSILDNPRWFMVDVQLVKKFDRCVSLDEVKAEERLSNMQLVTRGRISVQKVRKDEWDVVREMAGDISNGDQD